MRIDEIRPVEAICLSCFIPKKEETKKEKKLKEKGSEGEFEKMLNDYLQGDK